MKKKKTVFIILFGLVIIVTTFINSNHFKSIKLSIPDEVVMEYGSYNVVKYSLFNEEILELEAKHFITTGNQEIIDNTSIEIEDVIDRVDENKAYLSLGEHQAVAYYGDEQQSFKIQVKDTQPPVLNKLKFESEPIIQFDINTIKKSIFEKELAQYFYDADSHLTFEVDLDKFLINEVGRYDVSVTASDRSGNFLTQTFTIDIKESFDSSTKGYEYLSQEPHAFLENESIYEYMDRIFAIYDNNVSAVLRSLQAWNINADRVLEMDVDSDGKIDSITAVQEGTMGNGLITITFGDGRVEKIPYNQASPLYVIKDANGAYLVNIVRNYNTHNLLSIKFSSFENNEIHSTQQTYTGVYKDKDVILDHATCNYFDDYVKELKASNNVDEIKLIHGNIEVCKEQYCEVEFDKQWVRYEKNVFYPSSYYRQLYTRFATNNSLFDMYLQNEIESTRNHSVAIIQIVFNKSNNENIIHLLFYDMRGGYIAKGYKYDNYEFNKVYEVDYNYEYTKSTIQE